MERRLPHDAGAHEFTDPAEPMIGTDLSGEQPEPTKEIDGVLEIDDTVENDSVESADDRAYAEAVEAVDVFFDELEEDIARSHEAWKRVKALQPEAESTRQAAMATPSPSSLPLRPTPTGWRQMESRTYRRKEERTQEGRMRMLFGGARDRGEIGFGKNVFPILQKDKDVDAAALVDKEREIVRAKAHKDITRDIGPEQRELASQFAELSVAYFDTNYADYTILNNCIEFLQEKNSKIVVYAFLDRIYDIAGLANKGVIEYPGLLEVLAMHIQRHGEKSLLHQAMKGIAGSPDDYAELFLQAQLSGEKNTRRKELGAAIEIALLTATILQGDEFKVDREAYIQSLARNWQSWPQQMQAALQSYVDSQTNKHRTDLEAALKPFVRVGRLPAHGHKVQVDTKTKSVRQAIGKKTGGNVKVGRVAAKDEATEDVIAEIVQKPIDSFAYMVNTGSTASQNIFRLEEQGGIDDIMRLKHFATYIDRFRHEPGLKDAVRIALERITRSHIDRTGTKVWRSVHFYLEDSRDTPRTLRRFSLGDLPEVSGNSTAENTRIAYNIMKMNGVPTVVVYGIFHKQDIVRLNKLPKRR